MRGKYRERTLAEMPGCVCKKAGKSYVVTSPDDTVIGCAKTSSEAWWQAYRETIYYNARKTREAAGWNLK